jgi:hypothetical protein
MAKSNKANAIDTIVKTLSQVKRETAKPGKVEYIATTAHIDLAREAGTWSGSIVNAQTEFNQAAKALREAKVIIGDARNCPLAKAFLTARFAGKGKVAASTKANALTAFRKAVSSGKDYSENAYRKTEEKKTAAKTGPKTADTKKATHIEATETATTYQCTISRKGSAKKAAQVLRDLMNKMRDSEEYAPLAALIIDSLDEFDGAE